uniref:Uncharacterized protein n=1 Tax=Arundo donax TaxID=35708 RepID=A0A0A9C638_ARUDO
MVEVSKLDVSASQGEYSLRRVVYLLMDVPSVQKLNHT